MKGVFQYIVDIDERSYLMIMQGRGREGKVREINSSVRGAHNNI